jgi:hypothetical protein
MHTRLYSNLTKTVGTPSSLSLTATVVRLRSSASDAGLPALFLLSTGSSVAKFSGQHVAKRLVSEQAYREFEYEQALKKAFLGTDEDLRAGVWQSQFPSALTDPCFVQTPHSSKILRVARPSPLY